MQAIVNENSTFVIEQKTEALFLNDEAFDWDIQKISEKHFHILKDNQSYNIEVVEVNYDTKVFKLKINGETHDVRLKNKTDLLLEKMGLSSATIKAMQELKAPMPGLIYELKVQEGDTVEKGEVLLILVAMKMENAIKAAGSGVVKNILIKTNDSVEKGQTMITFE